ncbi:MAG: hypothetical protein PVI30_01640 [Myxococcales bacterium]
MNAVSPAHGKVAESAAPGLADASRSAAPARAAMAGQWIQSPLWDGVWMFSGLWAPVLSVLIYLWLKATSGQPLTLESPGFDAAKIAAIYLPLSILHRLTTTYAVLGTPILRDEIRKDRRRYILVPAAILLGCILLSTAFAFHNSFSFMPNATSQLWGFFVLAYVMVLWERWHFCAQEFGVLSIYRVRAKQSTPEDKRFDRLFTVGLMLGANMVLYVCLGFDVEREVLLHGTALSTYQGPWLEWAAGGAFVVGSAATTFALVRELRHPRRSIPKAMFYLLVGSHTVLLYWFPHALGLFFLSYVFHHWMVSVGLFGRVTVNAYRAQAGDTISALRKVVLRVTPLLALTVLFYLFFEPLDRAGNLTPLPTTEAFMMNGVGAKLLAGVVIGIFFALNFLHYYYDRCFYAFSTPAVRKTVGPLLFGSPGSSRR